MLGLTSFVVSARLIVHLSKRRSLEVQDFFIYFAYITFIGCLSLYISLLGPLKRLNGLTKGTVKPYPTIPEDLGYVAKRIWSAQWLFYTCVYSVKLSLLSL